MNHSEIVSFIWGVADLIRDTFKRGKYQDVILPLTVLRRLDCVLAPTREDVLQRQAELKGRGLEDHHRQLCIASGFAFYNTSQYDFERLLADAPNVAPNLRNYIAGFSGNMREVLERFDFDNTISRLDESGLLFQVLERFGGVDLHPDQIDNATMGTIFEELLRRFNEALNENPGEHFTPRDVVHLMVDLMLAGDEASIGGKGVVRTVYDPCCGSGGMLMIAKEHVNLGRRENGNLLRGPVNPDAEIHLFGQEVNPETWAALQVGPVHQGPIGPGCRQHCLRHHAVQRCPRRAEALTTSLPIRRTGRTGSETRERSALNTSVVATGPVRTGAAPHQRRPTSLSASHARTHVPRTQRKSGSRIAIIMNGSPLFTGDAGSGESEIRRYIFENDLLEALIALA